MKEIWKDVVGFEGLYEVSNLGNVRKTTGEILSKNSSQRYLRVCLTKGRKGYKKSIHRLVAMAFIPNPYGYETVNHIDENRFNNNVTNLEWCTNLENSRKFYFKENFDEMKVLQFSKNGNLIREYESVKKASRLTGVNRTGISRCLNGHRETAGGYVWRYQICNT